MTTIYAFLPGKTQGICVDFFQAIVDACERLGFNVNPENIVCDFEKSVINAAKLVLGQHINIHGCFYHLTQASWRKIQSLGLADLYKTNNDIKQFCGKIDGLAFLPVEQVPEGMQHLQQQCPPELKDFLEYFNQTYMSGTYRRIQRPALPGNNICLLLLSATLLHNFFLTY